MIEGSYYNHCPCRFCYHRAKKYHPKRFPLPTLLSSPKSDMPASEPFISKGTIEHSSNCEFLLKIYHFLSFFEVPFIDKTHLFPKALRSDLSTKLSLNVDVSENTLPFVSQSINNFSDYDISQTHDWKCPSLSPHVLLLVHIVVKEDWVVYDCAALVFTLAGISFIARSTFLFHLNIDGFPGSRGLKVLCDFCSVFYLETIII